MTEAEWLTATDPMPMLEFLRGKISDRKLRLFAAGCCRRLSPGLPPEGRAVVEASEEFADSLRDSNFLRSARKKAMDSRMIVGHSGKFADGAEEGALAAALQAAWQGRVGWDAACETARQAVRSCQRNWGAERLAQADLLRELSGNPTRAVRVASAVVAWNGGTVPSLARGIYEDRAFDRLPVLADALEDASGTDIELLGHLRGPGPHVRGCWAVDLVLGRS
jgi:hypothetical protein